MAKAIYNPKPKADEANRQAGRKALELAMQRQKEIEKRKIIRR
jgi:hypothetical protein